LCALETTVHEAAEHKATNLVTETGGAYRLSRNVDNQLPTYCARYPRTAKAPLPELWNWRWIGTECDARNQRICGAPLTAWILLLCRFVCHVAAQQRPGSQSLTWQ